jgi:glycerol-3-phosphate acyltransferase PlsX
LSEQTNEEVVENQTKLKIALDAMGGDYAPQNTVAGALEALRETQNRFSVILVGREDAINKELRKHRANGEVHSVVNASEVITFDDTPTTALKTKKQSSIVVGMNLHKEGKVDAFVSAGNTGAVLSASTLILGRIQGVGRPTIAAFLPSERGVCILLDAGANVDCRPQHLLEFAIMGSIYARQVLRYEKPSIGLLNVGGEASKGGAQLQEAFQLLSSSHLNFIGNIEGGDILQGKAQVVVCDGLVGNVVLKFGESFISTLRKKLTDYARSGFLDKLRARLGYGALKKIIRDYDYQEYGGVPVLGVQGVCIVGHGQSTVKAVRNMILRAEEMIIQNINGQIQNALRTAA